MARKITLWLSLVLIGVHVAFATSAWAASFSLSAADSSGAPGTTVSIPIQVADAQNIGSLELSISYDPAVLSPKEITAGDLLGGALVEFNSANPGVIRVAIAGAQVQGNGNLLKAQFDVKGSQGQESPIGLKDVRAWDATPEAPEMLVKGIDDGRFSVGGLPQMTIYLVIGALALALIVAFALFARSRKKS